MLLSGSDSVIQFLMCSADVSLAGVLSPLERASRGYRLRVAGESAPTLLRLVLVDILDF